MKHIIKATLMSLMLLFLISGCSNRDKAEAALKSSGDMLAGDAVAACLAAALDDILPSGKKFILNNSTVIKIVSLKNDYRDLVSESASSEIIHIGKKYDAVMRKITVSDIGFGPLEVSARNKNTFLCDMTFNVTEEDRSLFGHSGITAAFITPENWEKISFREKYELVDDTIQKLPHSSFDKNIIHQKIQKTAAQKRSFRKNMRIRWNHKTGSWELHSAGGRQPQQASWLSNAFNSTAAASYMKSRGFTLRNGQYYLSEDLPAVEQIERGNVLFEGEWISRAVLEQNRQLDAAVKKAAASGKYMILLDALQENPKATTRQAAMLAAERLIKRRLAELKRESDLEQIILLKKKLEAVIGKEEKCFDEVIEDITEYQKRQAKYYAARKKDFQKIINWVRDMYTVSDRSDAYAHLHNIQSMLNAENKDMMQKFLFLWTLYITPEKINEYRLSKKLNSLPQTIFAGCTSCSGGGEFSCSVCSNTRVCKNCQGRGYRIAEKFEKVYNRRRHWNGRRYVYYNDRPRHTVVKVRTPCPPKCQACIDRKLCKYCYGSGVIVKRSMLRIFIQDHGKKLLAGLKKQYRAISADAD